MNIKGRALLGVIKKTADSLFYHFLTHSIFLSPMSNYY